MIFFTLITVCMITFAPQTVSGADVSSRMDLTSCKLVPAQNAHFECDQTFEDKCNQLDPGSGWVGRTQFMFNSCLIARADGIYAYTDAKSRCASINPKDGFKNGHLVILDTPEKQTQFKDTVTKEWFGGSDPGWGFYISATGQTAERPLFGGLPANKQITNAATTNRNGYACQYAVSGADVSSRMDLTSCKLVPAQNAHFECDQTFEDKCNQLDPGSGWVGRTQFMFNSCLIARADGIYAYTDAKSSCASINPKDGFKNGHLVILDTPEKQTQFKDTVTKE